MILAGDVGGTNCRFAAYRVEGERLVSAWERTWPSAGTASLAEVVRRAREEAPGPLEAATVGVAGPVRDGVCRATNLPWTVDARDLAAALGLPAVGLLNDLVANALGIAALAPEDLLVVRPGAPDARGNAALVAPGTGLGEAGLLWDGTRHLPIASEGGHASFAPEDALQAELRAWLARRHGHVSGERILSGPGLHALHEFLRDTGRGTEPAWLSERLAREDPGAVVTEAALSGRSDLAAAALDLFLSCLGAEAGNVALKLYATGGVYLGGGIVPRIAAWLSRPAFHEGFLSKGRMRSLLETIPVRAILDPRTGLLGAARHAAGLA